MDNPTVQAAIAGVLRHVITAAGAYFVTEGFVTQAQWEQVAGGAAAIAVGIVWSIIQKHKTLGGSK